MSEALKFEAEIREGTGKGVSSALKKEGKVPAIIYGGKDGEVKIALSQKELLHTYNKGGFTSKVCEIDAGGKKIKVIPRDVQVHPVTDMPIHADFMEVDDNTKVRVWVKVEFHGLEKSPGLKRGGVLNIVRHEVELWSPVNAIPKSLHASIQGLMIGESVHISAIELPEGVKPTIKDRDFTIATIVGRAAKESEETAAGEEAAVEGEEGDAEGGEEGAEGGE